MTPADRAIQLASHPEVYTIGRVSTEFFLRGFEVIGQADEDILGGMIVMTLLVDTLSDTSSNAPIGIRELARRLAMPFETVRRQVHKLIRRGVCRADEGGVLLAPSLRRSARISAMLRKLYLEASRMLDGLRRIRIGQYRPSRSADASRNLTKEQIVVVAAAIRVLLEAMKALRTFFDGDLMTGLVFTAIRAANIKHITNTAPGANRDILPDSDRRPVSVLAISNSMKVPYETVRRHAAKLIRQGKCVRVGRDGVLVPAVAFRKMKLEGGTVIQLVFDFMDELRTSGAKV
jgi:DNA-binding IclR family transcriptional regulator